MKRNSTASNSFFKEKLLPLHRSITDDNENSYNENHPSPFTRFVSKLLGSLIYATISISIYSYYLGLKKTDNSTRPRMRHNKSNSTTSITKSSVILSSSYQLAKPTTANDDIIPQKRKTTITFAVPNNKNTISQKEQDETSSISSSSLISMSSLNSSISSLHSSTAASFILIHNKNGCSVGGDGSGSTAVDALTSLASASAKNSIVTDFDMPSIHLQERKESTEPVLTENIAETVSYQLNRQFLLICFIYQFIFIDSTLYSQKIPRCFELETII